MGRATRIFTILTAPLPLPLLRRRCHSFLALSSRRHKLFPPSSASRNPHHRLSHCHSESSSSVIHVSCSRQFHSQVSEVGGDGVAESAPSDYPPPRDLRPWPEWSEMLGNLYSAGYLARPGFGGTGTEDEFVAVGGLPSELVRAANACLAFARERPELLRLLSNRDIEVVIGNGSPHLFRNAEDSAKKMKLYLTGSEASVLDCDRAETIDLMRYLLSYAINQTISSESHLLDSSLVSSVRSLLSELAKLSLSAPQSKSVGSVNQFPERYTQTPRPLGPKIEMKRGDWICPRCSFMNFARNVKCLECEEARPKRQLTGGEWECPQCNFFNYGRNLVCLRCDCKRPGNSSPGGSNTISGIGYGNGTDGNKVDIDGRLAANEEKAQRWFSKVSQMDSSSDMSSAIADEDFPEIMPLRKGVNRFVVSSRKTPLERRLANSQYQRNSGDDGFAAGTPNQMFDTAVTQSSGTAYQSNIVPLASDIFAKSRGNSNTESEMVTRNDDKSAAPNYREWTNAASGSNESSVVEENKPTEKTQSSSDNVDRDKDQEEKSERWFRRVAELHNVTDLAGAIPDEDFPEIMPMRKGENRFVVSKKKDRSLTSPAYKRRAAMEQAGNTNFKPFVPFPPGYFAKKSEPESDSSASQATTEELHSMSANGDKPQEQQSDDGRTVRFEADNVHQMNNQNLKFSEEMFSQKGASGNQNLSFANQQTTTLADASSGHRLKENTQERPNSSGNSSPTAEIQSMRESWSGKSLEGSAVKELDPLDMSEEAKAERWFRRVAQIKDISELSQIPDEDFPSIMPMRKGVNRFVVSKRKTPLERRLTSTQYKKNLQIQSSDQVKKENNESS